MTKNLSNGGEALRKILASHLNLRVHTYIRMTIVKKSLKVNNKLEKVRFFSLFSFIESRQWWRWYVRSYFIIYYYYTKIAPCQLRSWALPSKTSLSESLMCILNDMRKSTPNENKPYEFECCVNKRTLPQLSLRLYCVRTIYGYCHQFNLSALSRIRFLLQPLMQYEIRNGIISNAFVVLFGPSIQLMIQNSDWENFGLRWGRLDKLWRMFIDSKERRFFNPLTCSYRK